MPPRRAGGTGQAAIEPVHLAFLCASVILLGFPSQSCAQSAASQQTLPATESEDVLRQKGAQLRAQIDATYRQLRASKTLKNTVNDGNDVTAIVLNYIPRGTTFEVAEAILRATGCTIGQPEHGHIFARAHMRDGFLRMKHAFAVELVPRSPGDFSTVSDIRASIYLEYVANANSR
jgi:hypothetical protein